MQINPLWSECGLVRLLGLIILLYSSEKCIYGLQLARRLHGTDHGGGEWHTEVEKSICPSVKSSVWLWLGD